MTTRHARTWNRETMPWGKHRGRRIGDVPSAYLAWCREQDWLDDDLRDVIEAELDWRSYLVEEQQAERARIAAQLTRLPTAAPANVCGVDLDGVEAGLFAEAVATGELVVGPDMPLASPVPLAWQRWCERLGVRCVVREVPAYFAGTDEGTL